MAQEGLKFDDKDISDTLLNGNKIVSLKIFFMHEARSGPAEIYSFLEWILEEDNSLADSNDIKQKINSLKSFLDSKSTLIDYEKGLEKKEADEIAKNLFYAVNLCLGTIKENPFCSKNHQEHIKKYDLMLDRWEYILNRLFSPQFKSQTYYLYTDFYNYFHNLDLKNLNCTAYIPNEIKTSIDYVTLVFSPIISNIFQHAYNPENNIFQRDLSQPFSKKIIMDAYNINESELEQTGELEFLIKDNGFGIKPENQQKIFTFGFTTKPEKEGHGIALAAVKDIVESQGGKISCKSDYGLGTEFKFTIPYVNILNRYVQKGLE